MNKELRLINLNVGKKHFKKWMKWLTDVHGFVFEDVVPFNQYLCIDVVAKAVWFCMQHKGTRDVSEPYELYELMFDHFRVQSDLKLLAEIKHDKVNVEQIADRDYVNSQIRNTSPAVLDDWYYVDFNGISKKYLIEYLTDCGFTKEYIGRDSFINIILHINPTKRQYKFTCNDSIRRKDNEASKIHVIYCITHLSNFINVRINQ